MVALRSLLPNVTARDSAWFASVTAISAILNRFLSSFLFSDEWMLSMFEADKSVYQRLNGMWFDDGQRIKKMYELWPPHQNIAFHLVFSSLCLYFIRYRTLTDESPPTSEITLRLIAFGGFLFAALLLPMRIGEFHIFVLGLNLLHMIVAPQVVLGVTKLLQFVGDLWHLKSVEKSKSE